MERFVADVAGEMSRRGTPTTLVIPEDDQYDPLARETAAAGIEVERLDTDARHGRLAQAQRLIRFLRLVRRIRPAVVHVHTGGATGGLAPVLLSRLGGRSRVVLSEYDVPGLVTSPRQRLVKQGIERVVAATVVTSRKLAVTREERLRLRSDKLAVVVTGTRRLPADAAEREKNRKRVREELRICPGAFVIGSVVRLVTGKGVETLIEAFALLNTRHEDFLVIVGEGPQQVALQRQIDNAGLSHRVILAGYHSPATAFMDAFDIFALAVPVGSGSIAVIEAMSRGLPAVITFGGPEEPVVDQVTGLNVHGTEGLAAAFHQLRNDVPARLQMGCRAEEFVRAHFSIERATDDLYALYSAARDGSIPAHLRASNRWSMEA